MTELEHVFSCLSEEAGEITQEVSKILRFGVNDVHPSIENFVPNEERLSNEINDLMGVVEMLKERGIKIELSATKMLEKKAKVEKYMEYARGKGTLI